MDIKKIIEEVTESQVKFSVLKLFKENPYIMDNRFGLSLWAGKPEDLLIPELNEMIDLGVIHRWGSEPGAIYAYTRSHEVREMIEAHWDEICAKAEENKLPQEKRKTQQSERFQKPRREEEV